MGFVLADVPAAAAIKVFLLAGQSNMVGYGVVADLPAPYHAPLPNVKFWDSGSSQWTALRGGFGGTAAYFGPEVSFGYQIHRMFPKDDVYLVKYAVGGTNLAVDWNPDGSGRYYTAFKSTVSAALQNLSHAHLSPTIAGMIWMQGESDTLDHAYAAAYAANLTNFIIRVRSDLAVPNMPLVVGRIESRSQYPFGTPADNTAVRTAQATVPGRVGHASWINTDDMQVLAHRFPEPSSLQYARADRPGHTFCEAVYPRPLDCCPGREGPRAGTHGGQGASGDFGAAI